MQITKRNEMFWIVSWIVGVTVVLVVTDVQLLLQFQIQLLVLP